MTDVLDMVLTGLLHHNIVGGVTFRSIVLLGLVAITVASGQGRRQKTHKKDKLETASWLDKGIYYLRRGSGVVKSSSIIGQI